MFALAGKSGELHMGFIIWLVVGGVVGWIASRIMRPADEQGVFLNIVVGIVGALVGGWLVSPLMGISLIDQDRFSLASMLLSLAGSVTLLAVVNLFQRGTLRREIY